MAILLIRSSLSASWRMHSFDFNATIHLCVMLLQCYHSPDVKLVNLEIKCLQSCGKSPLCDGEDSRPISKGLGWAWWELWWGREWCETNGIESFTSFLWKNVYLCYPARVFLNESIIFIISFLKHQWWGKEQGISKSMGSMGRKNATCKVELSNRGTLEQTWPVKINSPPHSGLPGTLQLSPKIENVVHDSETQDQKSLSYHRNCAGGWWWNKRKWSYHRNSTASDVGACSGRLCLLLWGRGRVISYSSYNPH